MHGPDTPRRYINRRGRHVLIGLTPEETLEFESIDALAALDESGKHPGRPLDPALASMRESRWLELYRKHENAWISWKTLNRADGKTLKPAPTSQQAPH